MAHAEKTVLINRPAESVFDFVLNGANNKLWRSSVTDARPLTDPPYGVGSKFEQGLRGPAGRIPANYEITASRPYELIRFRVTAGPVRPTGEYRFRRQERQTEITSMLDYQHSGLSKTVDSVSAQQLFLQMRQPRDAAEVAAYEHLTEQERHVFLLVSEGRTNREIARSLFVGEGTVRNYTFSTLSKVMEPIMQRFLNEEAGMLDDLKAFLEKHA